MSVYRLMSHDLTGLGLGLGKLLVVGVIFLDFGLPIHNE